MDEDTGAQDAGPRRSRATASASALGAAALLVLSFGPSALALTPSVPGTPSVRAAISAPVSVAPAPMTASPGSLRETADADDGSLR
ncbi:MAG: hypothetical protein ACTMII_05455 [Brachybacterium sp.]|uniref:hypothetical protein n=1 Tax=unclassified Brachybacterium TaxID=2623841 RepID=UPI003FD93CE5